MVGEITREEVASVNGRKPVYSGLFICRDWKNKAKIKDPEGHGLIPSEIGEAISGSMKAGAAGVALFVPGNMTDEHWLNLTRLSVRFSKISSSDGFQCLLQVGKQVVDVFRADGKPDRSREDFLNCLLLWCQLGMGGMAGWMTSDFESATLASREKI